MFKYDNLSLRAKLLGLMVGVSIVSLGLFEFESHQAAKTARAGKAELIKAASSSLMDKIDRNLFERYGDVQAFALSEPARSLTRVRIEPFMNDMMGAYAPIYDLMVVTDLRGQVVAANSVDKSGKPVDTSFLIGHDFSSEAWFKSAVAGDIKPGTALVEDLHVDTSVAKVVNGSGRVMNFTAPILDKTTGKVVGVWSNRMSWSDVVEAIVKEEIKKIDSSSEQISSIFSYLMNSSGQYLLHPDGASMEMKDVAQNFEQLKALAKTDQIDEHDFQGSKFKGEVLESVATSKGYSTYPGKGWYAVIDVNASDSMSASNRNIVIIATLIQILGCVIGAWVVGSVSKKLGNISNALDVDAQKVGGAAKSLGVSASDLASATTEQAAALQETAASIEEMNAMVKKSADNASKSTSAAAQTLEVVTRGKESVERMARSIEEINSSNGQIMTQTEESSRKIGDIVKVIMEIGEKTKVINDIVFQTKLLSFNASVEAARAGEHGKGFAVVAEEVGKLAEMSGNAAKDISSMLASSVTKVESIISESRTRIQSLVADGRIKVDAGTRLARECDESLEEIVKFVSSLTTMINEISAASGEQSQGIAEITKAMNQLDSSTHQNSSTSREAANFASQLTNQSTSLSKLVGNLQFVIHGQGAGNHHENHVVSEGGDGVGPRANTIPFVSPRGREFKVGHRESSIREVTHHEVTKRAVGSDLPGELPSSDDSRFSDI